MRIGKRAGLVAVAALIGLMSVVAPANASNIVNQTAGLGDSTARGQQLSSYPWGVYIIKNSTGKCLEFDNSSLLLGAKAQQWECKNQYGMYWRIAQISPNVLVIVNWYSGGCLEIENSSYNNGAHAQQWDCNGQPGSHWNIVGNNIINNSGKCLEIENSSYDNGAWAQQWDCVGQRGANWTIQYCGASPCAATPLASHLQSRDVTVAAVSRRHS